VTRLVPDETNFGNGAPATEALIDIRIEGVADLDVLQTLSTNLASEFPIERKQVEWIGTVQLGPAEPTSHVENKGIRGFLRHSPSDQSAVQVRRDGFTFSKFKPYTSWPRVSERAHNLWDQYAAAIKPGAIARLAVRYINHIRPPGEWTSSKDWLSINASPPPIPGLPAEPSDFFIRILQKHPSTEYVATVTVATVAEATGSRALLLDIDVAHEGRLEPDTAKIWSILGELRDFKNDIFYSTITKKSRELFSNVDLHS
jgi:uncharacterized protein (TIGR04255 family)